MQNKFMAVLLIGASLLGLNGCATVGAVQNNQETYLDSHGDYRLIERNNDIHMEKLDRSESRQITHTPQSKERLAWFTKNGTYIMYLDETTPDGSGAGAYLVKTEEDDSKRIKISDGEATDLFWKK